MRDELTQTIKQHRETFARRQMLTPGTAAYEEAVADEERLNAKVMELVRRGNQTPLDGR